MKILLATSNQDKAKEIKKFYKNYEIFALDEFLNPFDIVEDGETFSENAMIKARAVFAKLTPEQREDLIILSDDSGISVPMLGNAPGIYSARYSAQATDIANRAKLIGELKKLNTQCTAAFYTAAIGICSRFGEFYTHGFMHGEVIDNERGENGFGYDAMFIPKGFTQTLGELDDDIKLSISHRSKGLELMKFILKFLERKVKNEQI